MQHHQHANRRPQTLGVGSHRTQRGGGAAHEQVVNEAGVGQRQLAQRRRQREHHVMVFNR
jgi:hypothetical protein